MVLTRTSIACMISFSHSSNSVAFNTFHSYMYIVKNTIFISDFDKCFCFDCAAARGDAEANQAGNPPETFGVPWGYAKFGVR